MALNSTLNAECSAPPAAPHAALASLLATLNPNLKHLPVYQPGRPIEEVARELHLPASEIIKLASNENPLGPSPLALEAMQKAVPGMNLYPDGNAFYLKRTLAAKLGLQTNNLILGNGSNEIIEFAAHALISPQSEVVVSQYCFAVYPIVTHLFGGKLVEVPARDYGHDLRAMRDAVTDRTRIVFVANPNNPTGTLASKEEMLQLVTTMPPEVLLVVDEAYIEFLSDSLDLLPLIRSGEHPNLVLMRTFSKIYGLAGLRVGYGIGHPDVIAAFESVRQPFNLNSMAQAAALAALDDTIHYRRTLENNVNGMRLLTEAFQHLGLKYVPSSANFVLVRVGDGAAVFQGLQAQGVIVRPMGGYRLGEWIRVTVGTPAENQRFLAALTKVLNELKKSQPRDHSGG